MQKNTVNTGKGTKWRYRGGHHIYIYIYTGRWFGIYFLLFHSVGNVIIPTDFHSIIFQRDRYITR